MEPENVMISLRRKVLIGAGVIAAAAGIAIPSAIAATSVSVPAAGPAYGCDTGSSRVLEHVYTSKVNFENYLASHGGKCPGGFEVAIGAPGSVNPSPTPTPTTPTPTPPAGSWNCTVSDTVANDSNGACAYSDLNAGSNQAEYVEQDEWGIGGTPWASQLLQANSGSDWQVTVNVGDTNNTGAVVTYPDVQDTVTNTSNDPVPFTDYTSLTSTYDSSLPSNPGADDDYEAAYDMWLGDDSTASGDYGDYAQEVMVWTHNYNQTPAGSDTGQTWTDPSTGDVYEIWSTNTAVAGDESLVTFVNTANSSSVPHNGHESGVTSGTDSGSINLLALFQFMQADHLTAETGINQIDYGFEVCDTTGQNATFSVSGYTLNATGSGI